MQEALGQQRSRLGGVKGKGSGTAQQEVSRQGGSSRAWSIRPAPSFRGAAETQSQMRSG